MEEYVRALEAENVALKRALEESQKIEPSDLAYELHHLMTTTLNKALAGLDDDLLAFSVMTSWCLHAVDLPRMIDKELAKWPAFD